MKKILPIFIGLTLFSLLTSGASAQVQGVSKEIVLECGNFVTGVVCATDTYVPFESGEVSDKIACGGRSGSDILPSAKDASISIRYSCPGSPSGPTYFAVCDTGSVPEDDLFSLVKSDTTETLARTEISSVDRGEIVRIFEKKVQDGDVFTLTALEDRLNPTATFTLWSSLDPDSLISDIIESGACGAELEEVIIEEEEVVVVPAPPVDPEPEPPPPPPVCARTEIETAIGCVPFDLPQRTAAFFLSWGLGIGGGLAFLTLLYAGFLFATSTGDPKKLDEAKGIFISAISGILFLVFSVFLLRFIGVSVLGLF